MVMVFFVFVWLMMCLLSFEMILVGVMVFMGCFYLIVLMMWLWFV